MLLIIFCKIIRWSRSIATHFSVASSFRLSSVTFVPSAYRSIDFDTIWPVNVRGLVTQCHCDR